MWAGVVEFTGQVVDECEVGKRPGEATGDGVGFALDGQCAQRGVDPDVLGAQPLDQAQRVTEIGIQAAKANAELYMTTRSLAIDAAKVGAQVSAQLGAAAINTINWSTSYSNAMSSSTSKATSTSQSVSQSISSSNSTSVNTNYNYSV